jgi:hypothetical protein
MAWSAVAVSSRIWISMQGGMQDAAAGKRRAFALQGTDCWWRKRRAARVAERPLARMRTHALRERSLSTRCQ